MNRDDIFQNMGQRDDIRNILNPNNNPIINMPPQQTWIDDDANLSRPEKFLGKTLGTFKGLFKCFLIIVGLISIGFLIRPFFKLIIEFSNLAYDLADKIY